MANLAQKNSKFRYPGSNREIVIKVNKHTHLTTKGTINLGGGDDLDIQPDRTETVALEKSRSRKEIKQIDDRNRRDTRDCTRLGFGRSISD